MTNKRCLAIVTIVLLVGAVAGAFFVLSIGRFLDVSSPPQRADAIVVLGGEGDQFWRTRHALGLFANSLAPWVVFSGGTLHEAGLACSTALLSEEMAEQLGLPHGAAIILPESASTRDEAIVLGQLAQERGWSSLIVVTDRFHTRRVAHTVQALAPQISTIVSAPNDPRFDPVHWWQSEDGLVAVVTEVLKLGFYWAKYGISP